MILLFLFLLGAGLLAVPGALHRQGRSLPPAVWSRIVTVSLLAGVASVMAALGLLATPVSLRAAGLTALAESCDRMFARLVPGGALVGWTAGTALFLMGIAAVREWRRVRALRTRAQVEPWWGRHESRTGYDLVRVPSDLPLALAVPGSRPQVVVSDALEDSLSPAQFDLAVRHEEAHLRHGHHRGVLLAAVVERTFGWCPGARRSTLTLRASLERWADDAAAGREPAERHALREAIVHVAATPVPSRLCALGGPAHLDERLEALAHPPPSRREAGLAGVLAALPVSLGVCTLVALGLWFGELHSVLAMAGYCVS